MFDQFVCFKPYFNKRVK